MRRAAALIVGGGPAGSTAAIGLARGGMRPLLLEREREPGDALCGGFLSWRTLAALERLGLEELNGTPIERLRIFAGRSMAEARLPARAIGVSRRRLDASLLSLAERSGAAVERGVRVSEAQDRLVRTADGGEIDAEALLLATGKHDLRRLARPGNAAGNDPALGLRARLPASHGLAAMLGGAIELHLFDRGYAGLVLHEDGSANLCLAVRKSRLGEAGGRPLGLLEAIGRECPALGERLAWLTGDAQVDAIGWVPYGWRARGAEPGLFRLGDQAGVIASLAGEGIGIALVSGTAAAEALLRGGAGGAPAFQRRLSGALARPITVAQLLMRLAEHPRVARPAAALIGGAPVLAALAARLTRISI